MIDVARPGKTEKFSRLFFVSHKLNSLRPPLVKWS